MQTSELMCLGAGAAALSLLLCRQSGPGVYRAGSECSAYRAEVTAEEEEEADAAASARLSYITSAPLFGDDPAPTSWDDVFKSDDAPPAKGDATKKSVPSQPLPEQEKGTNSRLLGHGNGVRDAIDHHVYGPKDVDAPLPTSVAAVCSQPAALA